MFLLVFHIIHTFYWNPHYLQIEIILNTNSERIERYNHLFFSFFFHLSHAIFLFFDNFAWNFFWNLFKQLAIVSEQYHVSLAANATILKHVRMVITIVILFLWQTESFTAAIFKIHLNHPFYGQFSIILLLCAFFFS